jgi:hypothetical protein
MRGITLSPRGVAGERNRRARRAACRFDTLETRSLLSGYSYQAIQTIPGNAPNGAQWAIDFEPGGINNNGDIAYVADMSKDGSPIGEGFFVQDSEGNVTTLAFPGQNLPGELPYASFALSLSSINNRGDTSIVLGLDPLGSPIGVNAALFRGDAGASTLTLLVKPGMDAPGGGKFAGVYFTSNIDIHRNVIFGGIVTGLDIDPNNPPGVDGLGLGLFKVDASGTVTSVVRPGDPAPGGGVFDSARPGMINNEGDIAFSGHTTSLPCIDTGAELFCGESVYLRDGATGKIIKVAQQGDPAPGGRTYKVAFDPKINDRGDVAFTGDVTPGPLTRLREDVGVYLYDHAKGTTIAVAQPGQEMPGGGRLLRASYQNGNVDINSRGDVTFSATLDELNQAGDQATGLYRWSNGTLTLIARSDMVIPGVGQVAALAAPGFGNDFTFTTSGAVMNDRGQIAFQATLTDGTGVFLVATPNTPAKGASGSVATSAIPSPGSPRDPVVVILPSDAVDPLLGNDVPHSGPKKKS